VGFLLGINTKTTCESANVITKAIHNNKTQNTANLDGVEPLQVDAEHAREARELVRHLGDVVLAQLAVPLDLVFLEELVQQCLDAPRL
jgi:saccharopine dehydrogenase-like NADP-dependent oxidoreductase